MKAGVEAIWYDNWAQRYQSDDVDFRYVGWYGQTYEDTDFFDGHSNKGLHPFQFGAYMQDKIELDGMVVNAGLRWEGLFQNTWVTDPDMVGFIGLNSMTRSRIAPIRAVKCRCTAFPPRGWRRM